MNPNAGTTIRATCLAPAAAFFAAFWLFPVALLSALPASHGWSTYFDVLAEARYLASLVQTTLLSAVVTAASLAIAAVVGIHLGRTQFRGRRALISALTLPLSFPGVIIGFCHPGRRSPGALCQR